MVSSLLPSTAEATVIINGSRVIMDGNKNEVAVTFHNPDDTAYLVQSWVEKTPGDGQKTPFFVTPPLSRIDPGKINTLRIILTETSLPDNRESLFWLNIKAIPSLPSSGEKAPDQLVFIVKNVLKVIYRPASLWGEGTENNPEKLEWIYKNKFVEIKNPTPFVVTFNNITFDGVTVGDINYILPFSSSKIKLKKNKKPSKVSFTVVNDYGGESITYTHKII
ncbi:molecular chaperone [Serratia sp. JSRIV006]|uniref:fimbrial biogenesis chaperone n=1 Tax=Serratia sp. JSRIV006 TaxID=2831896 RepID=UPI001CC18190|nr:molecular chaperone [Serratia sp. JSRIV006]UAN62221.1 molecular chaperone [Serratia sp. JSRIV006]